MKYDLDEKVVKCVNGGRLFKGKVNMVHAALVIENGSARDIGFKQKGWQIK